MRLWIIKDILFGYNYNSNKEYRDIIYKYFEYLINEIKNKSNKDDYLIISSGLFSNTSPSIIAINDAIKNITEISKYLNIIIINSKKDNRKFDNEFYSTIDILHDINNVKLVKNKHQIKDFYIIPTNTINTDKNAIITDENKVIYDNNEIMIPSAIEFTENDKNIGILILDLNKRKHLIYKINKLPKHISYDINNFNDFDNINTETNNYIHLLIDYSLKQENESKLNLWLSKINPHTLRFKNITKKENDNKIFDMKNNDIKSIIISTIDDDKIKEQFNRILKINNRIE